MAVIEPRRSTRVRAYESNGREYLAGTMGWSRQKLEGWLTSPTVRPHLQLWYQLCVTSQRRFNEAVEWINTGERGYFYNKRDLEEDLLLACLGEGVDGWPGEGPGYADKAAQTGSWTTQELWARTSWRVVQANRDSGLAFAKTFLDHTSACYAFVIDVLCIAFHSIAFRGKDSYYRHLINGTEELGKGSGETPLEVADDEDVESLLTVQTASSSAEMSDKGGDTDCENQSSRSSWTDEGIEGGEGECEVRGDSIGACLVERWVASQGAQGTAKWASRQPAVGCQLARGGGAGYARPRRIVRPHRSRLANKLLKARGGGFKGKTARMRTS